MMHAVSPAVETRSDQQSRPAVGSIMQPTGVAAAVKVGDEIDPYCIRCYVRHPSARIAELKKTGEQLGACVPFCM